MLQKLQEEAEESAGAMSAQVEVSHARYHRHQQGGEVPHSVGNHIVSAEERAG